ncbi:MAG: phage portal protein, partial [Chromatiaceae bacterium]|nr:phage portal protein [Chromatiaceae bacterium]
MNLSHWISNLLKRDKPQPDRAYLSPRQAGVYVDEDRAMTHAAVWACVRIIAETIAALPWRVHQRTENGSELLENDLDYLLHVEPNDEQSALSFRETLLANALLWGNGYAEIEGTRTTPKALWSVSPDKIHPDRTADGELWYIIEGQPVLRSNQVYHLKGLGFDGMAGHSVIRHAARSVGIGIALDIMAAGTFANGLNPSLLIKNTGGRELSADGVDALYDQLSRRFGGPGNAMKAMYLGTGLEAESVSMPLDDAQFLESRKFQVSEIARWFRVPPHKLADLDKATFSNIEHQSLEFVTDTLVPWVRRLETEAQIKLIGRNTRYSGRIYSKINLAGLLRGDLASRYQAYATARQWGWLSANDIRALEDLNRIPGGDEYLAPMNMVPADMLREIAEPDPAP